MRETRLSGSEGGAGQTNAPLLPPINAAPHGLNRLARIPLDEARPGLSHRLHIFPRK
jgi:hypothetical protein